MKRDNRRCRAGCNSAGQVGASRAKSNGGYTGNGSAALVVKGRPVGAGQIAINASCRCWHRDSRCCATRTNDRGCAGHACYCALRIGSGCDAGHSPVGVNGDNGDKRHRPGSAGCSNTRNQINDRCCAASAGSPSGSAADRGDGAAAFIIKGRPVSAGQVAINARRCGRH